jgi:hypothetical protein
MPSWRVHCRYIPRLADVPLGGASVVIELAVRLFNVRAYARGLSDPAHLRGSLEWFRALDQDVADNAELGRTPLSTPALALGASNTALPQGCPVIRGTSGPSVTPTGQHAAWDLMSRAQRQ